MSQLVTRERNKPFVSWVVCWDAVGVFAGTALIKIEAYLRVLGLQNLQLRLVKTARAIAGDGFKGGAVIVRMHDNGSAIGQFSQAVARLFQRKCFKGVQLKAIPETTNPKNEAAQ